MRYRLLGRTGLRVSELFLGAMAFGEQGGGAPAGRVPPILDRYADAGGNVVDTATTTAAARARASSASYWRADATGSSSRRSTR